MNRSTTFKRIVKILSLTLIAGILAAGLWVGASTWKARAQESSPSIEAMTSNLQSGGPNPNTAAPNASALFTCHIANIAVFSVRIHVRCTTLVPGTKIEYFAASGDSVHMLTTNRFLMLLNTAYALGKPVYIYYFTDTASNPTGCGTTDCRGIDWMFIVP